MSAQCIIFTATDGEVFIPIFRKGSSLSALQSEFGTLARPRAITVSGMTVIQQVPDDITDVMTEQNCRGKPFYFGRFETEEPRPEPPRA